MNRSVLAILLLLIPGLSFSQVQKVTAKIVNTGSLFSTYDFDEDNKGLKSAISTQGCASILSDIINYSFEENWPVAISTFDSRDNRRTDMKDYNVYKIVSTSTSCILLVPANENRHMPKDLRPERDIYFIMGLAGVSYEGNINAYVDESKGAVVSDDTYDDWLSDYAEDEDEESDIVRIIDPGEVFSTYELGKDEVARKELLDSGVLTEEEFDLLCTMVVESYWPSGISTLSDRIAKAEKIKLYKAYFALSFESDGTAFVLAWIPKDGNEHMPANMQPTDENGFYMLFKAEGVRIE